MTTFWWRFLICVLCLGLVQCSSDNGGTAGDGGVDGSGNDAGDGGSDDDGSIGDRDGGDRDAVVLHDTSPDAWICDEMDFNIERVIPDMLLVLDRSGSMTVDDNWSTVRDAIYSVTEAMDESIWFGLMVFPAAQEPDACFNRMWHGQQVSENGCEPSRGPLVECAAGAAGDIRSTPGDHGGVRGDSHGANPRGCPWLLGRASRDDGPSLLCPLGN